MPYYDLEVFDVQRASRYGGNIRAYIARKGVQPIREHVTDLLAEEESKGLFKPETWAKWREKVEENKTKFMNLAIKAKNEGLKFVGNSCPGRGAVLLNYYGVDKSLMPYVAELPNGLKVGRYLPGTHIPVVSNEILFTEQPDYVVLLAWHYSDYMIKDLRARGLKSSLLFLYQSFILLKIKIMVPYLNFRNLNAPYKKNSVCYRGVIDSGHISWAKKYHSLKKIMPVMWVGARLSGWQWS